MEETAKAQITALETKTRVDSRKEAISAREMHLSERQLKLRSRDVKLRNEKVARLEQVGRELRRRVESHVEHDPGRFLKSTASVRMKTTKDKSNHSVPRVMNGFRDDDILKDKRFRLIEAAHSAGLTNSAYFRAVLERFTAGDSANKRNQSSDVWHTDSLR